MRQNLLMLFLLVLASIGLCGSAQAQGTSTAPKVSVSPVQASEDSPGYFRYQIEPGDKILDRALVENLGDEAAHVLVYIAEASTAVNGNTSFGFIDKEGGAAQWVSLDIDELTIEPGGSQIVTFAIEVPLDASTGDHITGLVVESEPFVDDTEDEEGEISFSVAVVQRSALTIHINLPGERTPELAVTDIRLARQHDEGGTFEVTVHNTGNVMIVGNGLITITDVDGTELAIFDFEISTILPGDETIIYASQRALLADGDYLLSAVVEYRDKENEENNLSATVEGVEQVVIDGQPESDELIDAPIELGDVPVIGGSESGSNDDGPSELVDSVKLNMNTVLVIIASVTIVLLTMVAVTLRKILKLRYAEKTSTKEVK